MNAINRISMGKKRNRIGMRFEQSF
jgi:hypothetical protein